MENSLASLENQYYLEEMPKIREDLLEWKKEMGEEGNIYREIYLSDLILAELNHIKRLRELYEETLTEWDRTFIISMISKARTRIEKIKKQVSWLTEKAQDGQITPEMVERAREYPISNLIEIRKNLARCVNHEDNHPSMNCKNNFVYCHSCGFYGDAIDLYRKITGASFVSAIKFLQGGI